MQHKFNIIFRRAGVVVFGAVLAAASAAFTAAQEPEPPFAGFASLSPEDQARALEGKSFAELYQAGDNADRRSIGSTTQRRSIMRKCSAPIAPTPNIAQALSDYRRRYDTRPLVRRRMKRHTPRWNNSSTKRCKRARTPGASKRPIADLLISAFRHFGYMQDGKFLYTREARPDLLSSQDAQTSSPAAALCRSAAARTRQEQEGGDPSAALGDDGRYDDRATVLNIPFDARQKYYIFFASKFRSVRLAGP
jgi:hypothetical protein